MVQRCQCSYTHIHYVLISESFKSPGGRDQIDSCNTLCSEFQLLLQFCTCHAHPRSTTTPRMFLGSPLSLSTKRNGTAPLSPTTATFKLIQEHLTIHLAWVSWDLDALLCWFMSWYHWSRGARFRKGSVVAEGGDGGWLAACGIKELIAAGGGGGSLEAEGRGDGELIAGRRGGDWWSDRRSS